jgi:hypothetical protein
MPQAKSKPAKLTVCLEDAPPESHDLAADKDWAVIFDDVLEVKARDGTHYYPLGAIRKWLVRPLE